MPRGTQSAISAANHGDCHYILCLTEQFSLYFLIIIYIIVKNILNYYKVLLPH